MLHDSRSICTFDMHVPHGEAAGSMKMTARSAHCIEKSPFRASCSVEESETANRPWLLSESLSSSEYSNSASQRAVPS